MQAFFGSTDTALLICSNALCLFVDDDTGGCSPFTSLAKNWTMVDRERGLSEQQRQFRLRKCVSTSQRRGKDGP